MSEQDQVSFDGRDALAGVNPLFVERWSPRAFQAHHIEHQVLARIFDAARWSPSCFNEQPWRFFTSSAETFDDFLSLLVEGNQGWAKTASVLGFVVGKSRFARNDKPNDWYQLDCGAAWMALTLQARFEGLHTHGMGGIKKEAVTEYLKLDVEHEAVLMGFAIGKLADLSQLDPAQREREVPSSRKPLEAIWYPSPEDR